MSVSTLANTKWVINNTFPSDFTHQLWHINFTSNNSNYNIFEIDNVEDSDGPYTNEIYYKDDNQTGDIVFSDYNDGWGVNGGTGAYRIIEITGGTDVTNATLIAWLEANATQVPVVDLSGTTWIFDSEPNEYDYDGSFYINFVSNNTNYSSLYCTIQYDYWGEDAYVAIYYENTWIYYGGSDSHDLNGWDNQAYRTISIINGTDVTNPDLIVWLTENATLQPNVKTFDLSTLNLSAGTHTVQVKARATGYRDSNFSNSVSYVVTGGGTVSFTITQQRTFAKYYLRIYDGQDATGTLLYESTSTADETLTPTVVCTTGYLYLVADGSIVDVHIENVSAGITVIDGGADYEVYKIEADGTISGYVDYQD